MSVSSDLRGLLDDLSRSPRSQVALRSVVPAAAVAVLVLERWAGGAAGGLVTAGLLLLALAGAAVPESSAPLFLVLLLAFHWAALTPERVGWPVLLAALALLALHLAASVAAYGPPALAPDPTLLRLTARRFLLAAAVGSLAWAVAVVVSRLHLPAGAGVVGAALAVALVWAVLLTRALTGPDEE